MQMVDEDSVKETEVGKHLSDMTARKVILIILFMLFTNPLFQPSTYLTEPDSLDYGLNLLVEINPTDEMLTKSISDKFIAIQKEIEETPLMALCVKRKGKAPYTWQDS